MQRQGQLSPEGTPVAPKREAVPQRAAARAGTGKRRSRLRFFADVWAERRKVSWPTRAEVVKYSLVVLITLILLISLIFLLDIAFDRAAKFLFR